MSMFDISPTFVNRSKAVSSKLQTGGVYVGIVTRYVSGKIYVRVPKLGGTVEYGPCVYNGVEPQTDDRVLVGFLDNQLSELICFGTLTRDAATVDSPKFTGSVSLPEDTTIGNVSPTEISYLDGVLGPIQDQINLNSVEVSNLLTSVNNLSNDKADKDSPTFTGTVSLPSTTSIGDVSATEVNYLDGATSNIQTQLNDKLPRVKTIFSITQDNYMLNLDDIQRIIQVQAPSLPTLINIPSDAAVNFPIGTEVHILLRDSVGTVTIGGGTLISLNGVMMPGGTKTIRARYSMVTLIKRAANDWIIVGDYS